MIYNIEEKNTLKKLESTKKNETGYVENALRLLITIGTTLFYLPLILFTIVTTIAAYIRNHEKAHEDQEYIDIQNQVKHEFNYDRIHIDCEYEQDAGSISFKMNYHALKSFANAIKTVFSDSPEKDRRLRELIKFIDPVEKNGFHINSDFFYPYLPRQIEVGTAEGPVRVDDAERLYASPELWNRICDVWMEVADSKIPKLIVLDKYQTDWCDPESNGRFIIEYIPDFSVRRNNRNTANANS